MPLIWNSSSFIRSQVTVSLTNNGLLALTHGDLILRCRDGRTGQGGKSVDTPWCHRANPSGSRTSAAARTSVGKSSGSAGEETGEVVIVGSAGGWAGRLLLRAHTLPAPTTALAATSVAPIPATAAAGPTTRRPSGKIALCWCGRRNDRGQQAVPPRQRTLALRTASKGAIAGLGPVDETFEVQ
jgi:hypothetical protein